MLFEFKVIKNEISKVNKPQKIRNRNVFNKCKFYFDEDTYKGKELFVTFISKNGTYQHIPLGQWANVVSCLLPSKFLKDSYFKVVAYAKNSSKTNTLSVFTKGRYKNKIEYEDALNYLLKELDKKIDNVIYENNQIKCYSGDILLDTIFIETVIEDTVKEQIEVYFLDLEEKLKKEKEQYVSEDEIDLLIEGLQ